MDQSDRDRGEESPTYCHDRGEDEVRPDSPEERVRYLEAELERREAELHRIIDHYETLLDDVRSHQTTQGEAGTGGVADRLLPSSRPSISPFRDD